MPSFDERAVAQTGQSIAAFYDQWFTALQNIEDVASTKDDTLALANTVSSRLAIFTDSFTDLMASAKVIQNGLDDQLDRVFAQFSINDIPAAPHVESPRAVDGGLPLPAAAPNSSSTSSYPPYIEPAYRWLLKNLHNPYPSKETRVSIALESGSDTKSVDSWFIDTRKRIGWNTIRKRHFSNKRADIVDAATRFFVQDDDKRPLDPTVEFEFAGLQKRAKDLYADRFDESTLAAKLDIAVKDLTPETKVQAREEAERRQQEARKREEDALAASCYPSPQRSPGRSPESVGLASLEEDEDLATAHPEAITGRKRRSMSPDRYEEGPVDRSSKRTRLSTPSPSTGLPSPAPSCDEPLRRSASPTRAPNSIPLPAISRKRRLSDADGQRVPKRPRGITAGPRLQAVSDPLPTRIDTWSMDQWFNAHFGIPNPAVVDEPDTTLPLDVQVFNYSAVQVGTPSTVSEPLAGGPYTPEIVDNTIPQLVADEVPSAGDALEISTNAFDINELFTDYEESETVFSGQDFVNHPQDISLLTSQPSALEFASIANFPTIPLLNTLNTKLIADANHPLSLDSTSNLDWFFPPFTQPVQPHDLLSSVDRLHDFGRHVLTQDPSLLFNNPVTEIDGLCATSAAAQEPQVQDKAEMQRQLVEMKEAMRRLEEKISISSLISFIDDGQGYRGLQLRTQEFWRSEAATLKEKTSAIRTSHRA
ncbi:putative homeobox KN domain containing protein [Lyophyllum shimeji]|uniref:Homeobox KN domain containing protein n=1 Tax=Lyophyllum shimeji TaxID=47721 RepID=A0A9P3PI81_LYOSH|nr:putative homeobox KN domain containing protein [Lyophyllum shimeji]